ncbi:hypothetical protein PS723_05380 [Pseudomonas fluorescens]|uniref:DUF1304 domain-containing protein n=1 Tax=Pseudomonas fluorescens TaxID=294 RepID=A0A5E7F9H4_PSEFL|nr:hypothetical protein [Pseudomonas fluorescens]VVO36051.1 hypothetical protein PS723_05380 [Pseudomonas fluorescens]
MLAQILISASSAIVLSLGTLHLVYTFFSNKFSPRDKAMAEQMKMVSPVISRQTTMWRAWIGFNASHSLGAMLFGLLYGYLSIFHPSFLLEAPFLLAIGALFLGCFLVLAKRYWFNVPLAGIACSLILFLVGTALTLV